MMDVISQEFEKMYALDQWGGGSGTGSKPKHNIEYVSLISRFISLNRIRTVVDFGCGDWQSSQFISWNGASYLGVDAVQSVVDSNSDRFGSEHIAFRCASNPSQIPEGDLLLCKDVFQHLPCSFIQRCLAIFKDKFRWLIITNDDYPEDNTNGEILPGGWRAIRLDQAPFNENNCTSLLSWAVISETPTVRKNTILINGNGSGVERYSKECCFSQVNYEIIPRRIFQTWKTNWPLPEPFSYWHSTIRHYNPDYEFVIWNDEENRNFISETFPWFLEKYDAYQANIFRVDAVRYFELFNFGGFYLDLDVECLSAMDHYLPNNDVLLGRMGSEVGFPDSIPNAIMASKPRQEFWLFVISFLLDGPISGEAEDVAGPRFLKRCITQWDADAKDRAFRINKVLKLLPNDMRSVDTTHVITILPSREWYPIDWSDPLHQLVRRSVIGGNLLTQEEKTRFFPSSKLVTYWSHSW